MTTEVLETATGNEVPWIPTAETFAARLALVRQHMGWGNVTEAANECALPVASWRNWERDGRAPRQIVEIARKIAARTGCDFLWLLTGTAAGRSLSTGTQRGEPTVELAPEQRKPIAKRAPVRPPSRPEAATRPPNVPKSSRRPSLLPR